MTYRLITALKWKITVIFPVLIFTVFLASPISGKEAATEIKSSHLPVYRIPLRVHLGDSNRVPAEWPPILEEINTIWLSQAGICFEMHTVDHDEQMTDGLDLWFEATIPVWNGYYSDGNDIHVRDDPDLRTAPHPAASSAARTAAHELGHALDLRHLQDSDDNLMRSKTYGWKLHPDEIKTARENAMYLALPDTNPVRCSRIQTHNNL